MFVGYWAFRIGAQHNGDRVMLPVKKDGRFLRAFRFVSSMKDWIHGIVSDPFSEAARVMFGKAGLFKHVIEHFSIGDSATFPKYKADNAFMAFNNGIYSLRTDEFFEHDSDKVPANLVCSVYQDSDMPWDEIKDKRGTYTNPDWLEIDTPLRLVYELQWPAGINDNKEIVKFLLAFIGRLLYNIGDEDNWQMYVLCAPYRCN